MSNKKRKNYASIFNMIVWKEWSDACKKIVPFSVIASATIWSRSPEFPIQVVQPYPTRLKPWSLKYFSKPLKMLYCIHDHYVWRIQCIIACRIAGTTIRGIWWIKWHVEKYLLSRYFVTTPDPGARLVLIHGLTLPNKSRQLSTLASQKGREGKNENAHLQ